MTWTPGWESSPLAHASSRPAEAATGGDAGAALARAEALFEEASDAGRLRQAIAAYDEALLLAPEAGDVLVRLAEAHILYGAAYAGGRREKALSYTTGIRYSEQAMAANPGFRRRVDAGEALGEASAELGLEDMRAMLFWVTGVSYYYKECLSGPGHLLHFRWMLRTRQVMERMMALDPGFEEGAVPFSLAIYFIGLPPSAGGDLQRAGELLAQAVAESPTSLLPRWGRAKYLHIKTGDRAAFRRELEWVVEQNPAAAASPLRWNVYFQRDARELLSQVERWF